jgi:hypothetical protein
MPVRSDIVLPKGASLIEEDDSEIVLPRGATLISDKKKVQTTGGGSVDGTGTISPSTSPLSLDQVAEGVFSWGGISKKKTALPANIPQTANDINSVLKSVHFGTVNSKQLADLYRNPNAKDVAAQIIKQYAPEATDLNVGTEQVIESASKSIKEKNRINYVNAEKDGIVKMDSDVSGTLSEFNKGLPVGQAGRMRDNINDISASIVVDDFDNNDKIAEAISKIREVEKLQKEYILNKDQKSQAFAKTQSLLSALNDRLAYNISRSGPSDTINQLGEEIEQSVVSKIIDSERGENINEADRDNVKLSQFKLGLSAVEKSDPVLFKNVINTISQKKKVSDTDFSNISRIGQQVDNMTRFRGAAYDPNLIDTETNFEYDTFGQKKAAAAAQIGEWMKEKGHKNTNEFPETLIRQAAKDLGIENKEIVNSLVFDEKLSGYDAIPKSGWIDDISRGVMQPLEGINSTLNSWNESPAETYLRSQSLEGTFGAQKVPDKKGQVSDILPSERGKFTTDMFRGLGQFIPQVLLTKGVGATLRTGAGLAGATLSGSQARNVADFGGTFISTFLQSYGPSYEEHLQKTGDANTAALMGTIDGISSASFELLLPDVRIAGKAFDGLKQGLATDLASLIKKGGDPADLMDKARPFVQKFFKSATNTLAQENLEELGTQYVDFVTESIFDPESAKDRNLNKELWDTFKSTTAAMLLPAVLGAGGSSFQKDFTTKSLHSAAINLDSYKESLQNSLDKEYITQDDFNKSVSLLETHKQSIDKAPELNANGVEIAIEKKLDYALEDTKIKIYKAKAEQAEGVAKEMWEQKIQQSEEVQREILMPKEQPEVIAEQQTEGLSPEAPTQPSEESEITQTPEEVIIGKAKEDKLGVYSTMVNNDPNVAVDILRDIAQQSYGVTQTGEPLEGGSREGALSLQFDTDTLEAAKAKFPTIESTIEQPTPPPIEQEVVQEAQPEVQTASSRLRSLLGNNPTPLSTNPKSEVSFADLGIDQTDTTDTAIDKLISYGGEFTQILQAIKSDPKLSGVRLEVVDTLPQGESGLYYPVGHGQGKDGLLQISNKGNTYYTAAHELLHFFTLDSGVAEQVKDTPSYKGLEDMYNYISSQKGKPITGTATVENYGLTNVKEFMAELLINPTFRDYVSDVFASNKEDILKASKNIRDGKVDSIADIILNFFRDLFNKLLSSSKDGVDIDANKSVVENAAQLATKLFFGGQDVIAGQSQRTDGGTPLSGSLSDALALPAEDRDRVINEFVKSEFESGTPLEEIVQALIDNGFTQEQAESYIKANRPKIRVTAEDQSPSFENKEKSILNRINESKNISQYIKDYFNDKLKYDPQSHSVARSMARAIVNEFGVENAITMAESGRFNGDVNSLIFAEGIDQVFEREQAATTPEGKQRLAEQWADYAMRYDEMARQKGRFISAIYDFYRKSPLGIIIAETARRYETFRDWFKSRDKDFKDVWDAIKEEPEVKELIEKEVESKIKEERSSERKDKKAKVHKAIDDTMAKWAKKLTVPGTEGAQTQGAGIVDILKAVGATVKVAYDAGEVVVKIVQDAIDYVSEQLGHDNWDKEAFRSELENQLKSKKPTIDVEKNKERILERFRKKLTGLSDKQKEDVIRRSFKQLVDAGALEYDDFKKIVADVIGVGELSPEEISKINDYVKDINAVQDAADKVITDRSEKSIEEFDKVSKKAEKSATELGNIVNNKTSLLQRVRSIIQLNTLGLVSLIKNPFYNAFNQIFIRFPRALVQTLLDQSIYGVSAIANKIVGTPVVRPDVNIFLAQRGFFTKAKSGAKESMKQVFTGLTSMDYFQKEIRTSQIKPFQSWRDLWLWKKGEKFMSNSQIADKVIQGTVGIPAEAVARMLNIGDKPFRFAAEGAIADTIASQEFGIKNKVDKEIFVRFPKEEAKRLYIKKGLSEENATKKSEAIEERIVSEGEQAVFQQKNLIVEGLNGLGAMMTNFSEDKPIAKGALGVAKIVGTLNAPFLKTPLNIFWDLFNIAAPEVAVGQSAIYGFLAARERFNGNKEKSAEYLLQSKKWIAHASVGYSLLAVTGYLASIGAVSGSDDEEKEKERKGKKAYQRPRSLNTSKMFRALFGGDISDQDNDLLVDLSWMSIPGVLLNMQQNRYENMTAEERKNSAYMYDVFERMHQSAAEGLENGVFQGTIAGINAFKQGGRWVDTWMLSQINVASNFLQPATMAQLSRGLLPYNYQIKADTFGEELRNNFAARNWLFRAFSGYPPSDITVWGDPAMRNNTGVKGLAFNMLGFDEYNKDAFAEPIFQDFKRTGNSSFFPPAVRGSFSVDGQDMKMTIDQERQFKTLVGQARKSLIGPFVNGMASLESSDEAIDGMLYTELGDTERVKALNILYKNGYEAGKDQFKELYPEFQTTKEKEEE